MSKQAKEPEYSEEQIQAWKDSGLCFTCHEKEPTMLLTRNREDFKLCSECCAAVEIELRRRNRVKSALSQGHGGKIFTMTLGASLLPTRYSSRLLEKGD